MGLLYCFFAFCEAGDNILVPEIGYPFYTDVAKSLGVEAREYRLLEDHNFEIDLEHAKTLIDGRTKYIYVINPSNPMGSVFSRKHML
jgi:tyrosine aminotransferase